MKLSRPAGAAGAFRSVLFAGVIGLSVSGLLYAQETSGVDIDPNIFETYLQTRLQKPSSQATPDEVEAVRNELTDIYLLSSVPRAAELKQSPRVAAQLELQKRAMLAQAVATDFIAANQATDEETVALYEEQIAAPASEFKARHILVETQGEAIALIAELEGGADFAELASEKSTGPSASTGGDLGWFPPERMVPEFSAAVQSLADGQFTKEPVQTQFGWHVILREGTRESTPPPYESVKDVLKQQVENQKLTDYLESLRN